MKTEFANIGMKTIVQKGRVMFITSPNSVTAQRYIDWAKKTNKFHNATKGRSFRSIVVLDDGTVIMSMVKPMTLLNRMNDVEGSDEEMEKEENEDEAD